MTAQYRPKGSSVLWCPGQQFPDVPCQLVMGTHGAYSASLETLSEGSFLILMCQLCMSHTGGGGIVENESPALETAQGGMSAGLSIRMCSQFRTWAV